MPLTNEAKIEGSHLGNSAHFRGEVSGKDDIFVDGELEGTIQLPGQAVTIGQHGNVKADIVARDLVVHGKLKGNVQASDRIEISRTGSVWGDLAMARISIHDGAFFQGRVDIRVGDGRTGDAARPVATASVPGYAPSVANPGTHGVASRATTPTTGAAAMPLAQSAPAASDYGRAAALRPEYSTSDSSSEQKSLLDGKP